MLQGAITNNASYKIAPISLYQHQVSTADSNWLAALQTCIADGGTLAKPETAAENTEIQTLLGEEEYNYLLGNKI